MDISVLTTKDSQRLGSMEQIEVEKYLKEKLSEERFRHSLETKRLAQFLALTFGGADPKKAGMAGLLHDIGRTLDDQGLLLYAQEEGIMVRWVDKANPVLLHGKVGASLAQRYLGIKDLEILRAIESHVTGRKGWTMLEKIVYLADKAEPGRDFPGVQEIRKAIFQGCFDRALLLALKSAVDFVKEKNPGALDPETELVLSEESEATSN